MIEGVPSRLFKYLSPEHAQSLLCCGDVRVGTLFEFREIEDAERGDPGEGTLRQHSSVAPRIYNSTAELPPVLRRMNIHCGPGGLATAGAGAVVLESTGRNMMVYCMSEQFDVNAMNSWGGDCVEIRDPFAFLTAVDGALRNQMAHNGRRLGPLRIGRCQYGGRNHDWHDELPPPWLLKPARYRHQAEVRAAWGVDDSSELSPTVLQAREIAGACRSTNDIGGAT